MDQQSLLKILTAIQEGREKPEAALAKLQNFWGEELGHTFIDHHRELRRGYPEVIYGAGKTEEQIGEILTRMIPASQAGIIISRIDEEKAACLCELFPVCTYHQQARMLTVPAKSAELRAGKGMVAVVCAGTSDIPVAEEAALTAEMMGANTDRIYDVGVAGLHRILSAVDRLRTARVIIVVAGMEAALGSVVGGLVDKPIIGVPTSVGYGASFGGVSALLGLLNSCSSGMTVVNIDNGFGAGYAAAVINKQSLG